FALRAVLHAGVISGLLGLKEIEQYGAREVTSA
ncbi:glycosyltransferase family 2 protein, partial [Sinorhizobium meliloti]